MDGVDPITAMLAAVGTAVGASASTAVATGATLLTAGLGAATTIGTTVAGALSKPKMPGLPSLGPTKAEQDAQTAAAEGVRSRRGRGSTLLTGGAGAIGGGAIQAPKSLLGL
jgi:hypothetical protein